MKISVVVRNKNEAEALEFLLEVLHNKYTNDIDEVIVIDNLSSDDSEKVCERYGARFVTIRNFSYGGSANLAASEASHEIVVLFSAHSYPVSHDFFKIIKEKFLSGDNTIAGLRCIHNNTDYKVYLKGIKSEDSPNLGGVIFAGSAFSKIIWKNHPFNDNVRTYEDKEWSIRMLQLGYKIEIVPCIFSYHIRRSQKQLFFRFKNDILGGYQIFGEELSYSAIFKNFLFSFINTFLNLILNVYYNFQRLFFCLSVKIKGFKKFDL